MCPIFTIEYYQPYFNIDQRDIKMRLRCSFLPRKPEFLQIIGKNPDLWGPLWITTTIIFLLFTAGNFSIYLASSDKENFKYNYGFLPVALATVYGMGFLTPIILTVLFRFFGGDTLLLDVICLYGYSMACFIPILILCIIPSDIFQWILLVYGIINSTTFLIVNLWEQINFIYYKKLSELKKINAKKPFQIIAIIAFQLVLLLMFKLYFFHLIFQSSN